MTLLVIDEFGKLLEYAVKNSDHEEIYFVQQLAEVFNNPAHNGLLITALHQSFEAYGQGLSEAERNEWVKIKGRFKDLTFNEPIEQLLFLATNNIHLDSTRRFPPYTKHILQLQNDHYITKLNPEFSEEIATKLWPLDVISAYLLCVAFQRYGQNERSLFSFLNSEIDFVKERSNEITQLGIPELYDYLFHEFYSYLNSKYNTDYTVWSNILMALDRVDANIEKESNIAENIIKVIGLINLFGHRGAQVDEEFVISYLSYLHKPEALKVALNQLVNLKTLRFNRFSKSYKITEGTDVNIENELLQASGEIEAKLDIVLKLKEYFDFSVFNAKAISYKTGTPRFFQYCISDAPLKTLPKKNYQVDGQGNRI